MHIPAGVVLMSADGCENGMLPGGNCSTFRQFNRGRWTNDRCGANGIMGMEDEHSDTVCD